MMRDTSSRSSMIWLCARALRSTVGDGALGGVLVEALPRCSSQAQPRMALSGVRSSCETVLEELVLDAVRLLRPQARLLLAPQQFRSSASEALKAAVCSATRCSRRSASARSSASFSASAPAMASKAAARRPTSSRWRRPTRRAMSPAAMALAVSTTSRSGRLAQRAATKPAATARSPVRLASARLRRVWSRTAASTALSGLNRP